MGETASSSPVTPDEPLPVEPSAIMILVNELPARRDLLAAVTAAGSGLSDFRGGHGLLDRATPTSTDQVLQCLGELSVRKVLNQGHVTELRGPDRWSSGASLLISACFLLSGHVTLKPS